LLKYLIKKLYIYIMQLFYFMFHTKVDTERYNEIHSSLFPMYTVGTSVKAVGEQCGTNRRTGTVEDYILHWPCILYIYIYIIHVYYARIH
jgi:hypothetical protein